MSKPLCEIELLVSEAKTTPGAFIGSCNQCGKCCEQIPIGISPRQFDEMGKAASQWLADNPEPSRYSRKAKRDLWAMRANGPFGSLEGKRAMVEIARMLAGRCLGKWVGSPARPGVYSETRYVYGPCRNLRKKTVKGRTIATCAIYETRPRMCRGYPFYSSRPYPNPVEFQGCTFNQDPDYGITLADGKAALLPLESREMPLTPARAKAEAAEDAKRAALLERPARRKRTIVVETKHSKASDSKAVAA